MDSSLWPVEDHPVVEAIWTDKYIHQPIMRGGLHCAYAEQLGYNHPMDNENLHYLPFELQETELLTGLPSCLIALQTTVEWKHFKDNDR